MTSGRLDGQRSMGSLLRDLAEGSATLVKNEVRLARLEVNTMLKAVGVGTAEIAVGGVLALLGTLAFFTGLVLLPGDQWLREGDLRATIETQVREHPGRTLLIALGVGYMLGKTFRK